MSNYYIEWYDENHETQTLQIVDKVFIGRICKGIDKKRRVLVNHPAVSRIHAIITLNGEYPEITDLSRNGTLINEVRMTAGSRTVLKNGDIIEIGPQTFTVNIEKSDNLNIPDVDRTLTTTLMAFVTCLVADVRDFSSIAQDHHPADTFAVMKEIFGRFSDIVIKYNGTIKDYAGDSIFAYWMHSTKPIPDQAILAIKAARGQCHELNLICSNLSPDNPACENLRIGWGLSTGLATLSHYGAKVSDIALVGDCVNLAFRLSSLANKEFPNKIIVCNQTATLIENSILLHSLGPTKIKGRTGKEKIFGIVEE